MKLSRKPNSGSQSIDRLSSSMVNQTHWSSPTRWIDFARNLGERWDRWPGFNDRLTLTFLQPLFVSHRLYERWMVKAERLLPRINLSVNFLLRLDSSCSFARVNPTTLVLAASHEDQQSTVPHGFRLSGGHTKSHHSNSAQRDDSHTRAWPVRYDRVTPIERIFTRTEPVISNREMTASVRAQQILERLILRSERTEVSSTSTSATTRLVSLTSITQSKLINAARDGIEAPVGFEKVESPSNRHRSWEPEARREGWPGESAINIEQIADQVMRRLDKRVVATRERMGRTF
jgi:hypothetical protein